MLGALNQAFQNNGRRLVALMRVSLIVPYNFLNYFMGTTSIEFKDYFIGSLAMIITTIMYGFIGCGMTDISGVLSGNYHGGKTGKILLIIGFVFIPIIFAALICATRRELRNMQS